MMNRFKSAVGKTPIPLVSATEKAASAQSQAKLGQYPKSYARKHKEGPELLITKILMINGPLQNKEIWRVYTRMLKDSQNNQATQKINYFQSLTQLKRTLKFMRTNEKIKSHGYDKKMRQHKGWQIQKKRALKYVHPQVIKEIEEKINSKDAL